ncbi:Homeobox-leucine zipper protein HOX19 [Apostasia shenzhenica]|uniref:Homeobox-leucine zipper protein HOX19 n=1 Tax=Apostasia shenzhenica TaxID=1088818 RepID=A0A2I0AFA4_9ASPA|nr:Homeobox-leucine zipper protein HOX19 [Apostasia shenzhenica]
MEVVVNDSCDADLVLRLGSAMENGINMPGGGRRRRRREDPAPYLTLSLSDHQPDGGSPGDTGRQPSPHSAGSSSFSNIKNGAEAASDETEEDGGARKKLRLTKEQSALLEDRFKEHSSLNPKQKLALAKQLNLRPRQVEVWFQNRRARTKLKQTEVDCEFLRRFCETLTDENRRLHRELQELKALKLAPVSMPLYMQLPAAAVTVCPACDRVAAGDNAGKADDFPATKNVPFLNGYFDSGTC